MDEIKIHLNYNNIPKIIKSLKMEGYGWYFRQVKQRQESERSWARNLSKLYLFNPYIWIKLLIYLQDGLYIPFRQWYIRLH
jgi:hypothetical protein